MTVASAPSRPCPLTLAGEWFLHSGIQTPEGGVARYYRGELGRNARVSTEITGYAVSTFVELYRRSGDERYRRAACRSAEFLIRSARDSELGIFPFEWSPPDQEQPEALGYFFDTGIIARGLLALWRLEGDAELLRCAGFAGESLARHFPEGRVYHPILRLPSLRPLPHEPQWSRSPGCYQLKSAMAWHDLAVATGREDFRGLYEQALRTALDSANGFLPADTRPRTMDRLHAYCYFLEGILPVADRAEVQDALADGIERVSSYLRDIRSEFVRSDVYAQLLRVRLLANQLAGVSLNRTEAAEEEAAIPQFLVESSDLRIHGGYSFGRRDGAMVPHANPVSTGFCLQALNMAADHRAGVALDLPSLV